ncbi:unnamed protein product [Blepharisma stoltei]|uniref:Acyl-CoA oxidase n=1 Tax=Blepharisma stoltei TaxID=1481888 RepID=A0AAU9ICE3_9CILI|nr:unnamed protein product [Blepharisma stoltei]
MSSLRLNLICRHLGQNTTDQFSKSNLKTPYVQDPIDFLHLDELLPADLNNKRKQLRAALEANIAPHVSEWYDKAQFPAGLAEKLRPLNIFGITEEKYGCRKVCPLEKSLAIYELARIDASLATFYALTLSLVAFTIEKLGSEEQKAKYLPKLCNLDIIASWGLTEPDYGSDASSLETTATPVKGGYILNGVKRWLGNAIISDIMIIFARNTVTQNIEGFIMDSKAKGVSVTNINRKLALRIVQNGNVFMKDVFIPENERLEKGHTFATGANVVLEHSRMNLSWMVAGLIAGTYEHAVKYIRERTQFRAPLAAFQLNQEKLVRILAIYQAVFLMSWRTTMLLVKGQGNVAQASLVKGWCSYMGREATRLGREVMGGNGIIIDNYAMKALVDMEVVYTYEGTYDVNALVAGRAATGVAAFKAGYKA